MKKNRKKMQNARQFKPENIKKCGKNNRGFGLILIAVLIIATMCMSGCNSGTNDDEVTVSSGTEETDVTNASEVPVESEPIEQEPAVDEPEVTDEAEVSEESEETEEREVISIEEPNTTVEEFIEYISTFGITETVIIYDNIDEAKFMLYNGDSCEIGLYTPFFSIYSPGKEIVEGHVFDESREELQGVFYYSDGIFEFCVEDYFDGDVYISVEYSDGTTEELTIHFIDIYNQ